MNITANEDDTVTIGDTTYTGREWRLLAEAARAVSFVEVFKDGSGEGRFTPVGGNGEPLLQSEGYAGGLPAAKLAVLNLWPLAEIRTR